MRFVPAVVGFAVLAVAVAARAEDGRNQASRLISTEAKPDGTAVPRVPKVRPRLNLDEYKPGNPKVVESKPAENKAEARKSDDERDPEILVLPKVEVTAPESTPFEKQLDQLDQEQAWEERNTKLSWLEALLNGKASANGRTERAKARVEIMNWERLLQVALVGAKTDEERAKIWAEIAMFKAMRR